ncbi:MAG: membrane dipeptidase [Chitinophagaceae bacterium]|nr:membrane dipeptidase [Chitinophagaceae bacterium]
MVLADTHNDLLTSQTLEGRDVSERLSEGHSDIPRLMEGGVDIQFFSVWTGEKPRNTEGFFKDAMQQIDSLEFITLRNVTKMSLASNYRQVKSLIRQDKLVGLIGVEGGHMIEDDMEKLEILYQRGMMYLTLTHNNSTSWASSARDETLHAETLSHKGLNDFGRQVVKRMNERGIMIDLSHAGEQTFYDVLGLTTKPVILSHSSVYSLSPHFRNVNDDQIRALARNNGVICINFYSAFLSEEFNTEYEKLLGPDGQTKKDSLQGLYADRKDKIKYWEQYVTGMLERYRPSYTRIADHIDYIVKMVGIDYVGIGADLDGVDSLPVGFDDATDYPLITQELIKRGYSTSDIKKISGKNVLRVLKANAR